MRRFYVTIFFTSFLVFYPASKGTTKEKASKSLTGKEVAMKMDAVDTSKDSISSATMTITRKGQTLTRKMVTFSKVINDQERSLIVFKHPSDIKNVKYLIWAYKGLDKLDDMWIYLPSESLVRRISGSSKHASFMRSDLANEDIQEKDDIDEYDYKLMGSARLDNIDCYILERLPKEKKDSLYSKQVEWVRKDNWLRKKTEFYDRKGTLLKTAIYDRQELLEGIWTVTKMTVETPKEKSKTVIDWDRIVYNQGLEDTMFEHSQLKR